VPASAERQIGRGAVRPDPRLGDGVTRRQVEGVRWIGDGCPDGVMVETGRSRSRLVPFTAVDISSI